MSVRDFFIKHRETAQLVYGIILIVLIPLLIVLNTVAIIKNYNSTLEEALHRHALVLGRSISVLIENDMPWDEFVQRKIEILMDSSLDIQGLAVLRPERGEEGFRVVASSDRHDIGRELEFYFYKLAWIQPGNDGLATESSELARTINGSVGPAGENNRFWLVAMPMRDADGLKQALLTVKLSSAIVDDMTNYNRRMSWYILLGTVAAVIMFLLVAVRLWDYVLLYKKTKEIDRMKDDFISMASHELRAPVGGIRTCSSMMLKGEIGQVDEEAKQGLDMIKKSSDRLNNLVDDLLNVSRIEQGRLQIEAKETDATGIIKGAINEFTVQARERGLEVSYRAHADKLPPIKIDPYRLKQVLVNLIGNAIKYTPTGSVEVITGTAESGKLLEIKVKDTGIGMSAEDEERLFEKFYRIRNKQTKGITGTGLGLWIAKRLTEMMGGKIYIDSIENVGTQVTLEFPVS